MIKEFNQLTWQEHVYGTSKYLKCKKEKTKCNDIVKQYKHV